jgi:hypothetical protein
LIMNTIPHASSACDCGDGWVIGYPLSEYAYSSK